MRCLPTNPVAARGGFALLGAAAAMTVVMVLMVVGMATFETKRADVGRRQGAGLQEEFIARSVIGIAVEELWSAYAVGNPPESSGVGEFRAWLDARGLVDGGVELLEIEDLLGVDSVSGAEVLEIQVQREDEADQTQLNVEVHVRSQRDQGVRAANAVELPGTRLRSVWTVQGEGWKGADFALLTRNLGCAVCHMHVDNAQRFYNDNPSLYGSFDIAKVGALHSFRPRSKTDSSIAGKLYVGDTARTEKGKEIEWSKLGLELADFLASEKLVQDGSGDLSWGEPVTPSSALDPLTANLHLDYASGAGEGDDGMPTEFPPVFPDEGDDAGVGAGDHVVQAEEYEALIEGMTGSLTGGAIAVIGEGEVVDTDAERAQMLAGSATLGTSTLGNVVLSGTPDDPLVIDGDIAIFGDVILRGTIRGAGSIKATGNVYIVDNVEYLDGVTPGGNRSFGTAADGTANSLGIAAGGNIMVGDFIRADKHGGRNLGTTAGPFSFIANELATFNKEEWLRAQPRLPLEGESLDDPASWSAANPHYAGDDYVPRYYALSDGEPIPILIGDGGYDPALDDWDGESRAKSWDDDALVLVEPGEPLVAGATVKPMFPSGWIDPSQLDALLLDIRQERIDEERYTWQVDAALYTSNSILGLAPKDNDMGTNGKSIINGGILAADFGILSTEGLYLNHDTRSTSALKIGGGEGLSISRTAMLPAIED